eukprot:233241_1
MKSFYISLLILPIFSTSTNEFECIGSNSCLYETIDCAANANCNINCDGSSSCSYATINCPKSSSVNESMSANNECTITCDDLHACSHLTVNAESSSSLKILSNGVQTLAESNIYCPNNDNSICNITYISSDDGLNDINIYSVYHENVNIECTSIENCWSDDVHQPILYYGDNDYSQICEIDTVDIDGDIICSDQSELSVDDHEPITTTSQPSGNVLFISDDITPPMSTENGQRNPAESTETIPVEQTNENEDILTADTSS